VSSGINIAGMLDRERGEPVKRNVKFQLPSITENTIQAQEGGTNITGIPG
jgi:hypothetical protein